MNIEQDNILTNKIDVASNRIQSLYRSATELAQDKPSLFHQCLEELGTALEELYTAEEELRQTNEELVRAWTQVEEERRRYRELFEFAPDAYLITDMSGKIKEANRAAVNLFNISSQYLIGKLLINFIPESERKNFRVLLNQIPTINRIQEWEIKFCPRHSDVFYGAMTVEIVRDQENTLIGLRWLIRDITTRKQAEEHLYKVQLQNLQLIEADRLKSQFLSTISHELRTPLNAILGFSQLLMTRLKKQDNEPLMTFVERILRNGKNLLTLIEDLLDFTKLESDCLQLQSDTFDLVELAKSTCEDLGILGKHKALELRLETNQPQLRVVHDSQRVRQILVNLISNAIKFTEEGSILLQIEDVSPDRVMITVKDTGIGIDSNHLPHIFKEFWQVNQSISRQYNGTGLGLAITHALVKLMQGTIQVESELGEGTIFRVELPRVYGDSSCSSINNMAP